MTTCRVARSRTTLRGARTREGWPRQMAGALLLALLLSLAAGMGQARAAAPALDDGGSIRFVGPSYQGAISGPVSAQVEVDGSSWNPYSKLTLILTRSQFSCYGVSVGSFPTDASGKFDALFLWPSKANQVGTYFVCGTQTNYGSTVSNNSYSLLSSHAPSLSVSPKSLVAGGALTVTGSHWLPGPQTLSLVIVPCNTICDNPPVAEATIVTHHDGTFSQQLTISAGAATGAYYAQAVNSVATLSAAPTGPIQVTGQASSAGTPVPGVNPTTTATRTTQETPGSTTSTIAPPSSPKTAAKDAIVAGVLGLFVLLLLIGGLAFFIGRSRGPDLPQPSRLGKGSELPDIRPGSSGRVDRRIASPAAAGVRQQREHLALPQRYRDSDAPLQEEMLAVPDTLPPPDLDSSNDYPWEEQVVPPAAPQPDLDEWDDSDLGPGYPQPYQDYPQTYPDPGQPPTGGGASGPFTPRRLRPPRPPADEWDEE